MTGRKPRGRRSKGAVLEDSDEESTGLKDVTSEDNDSDSDVSFSKPKKKKRNSKTASAAATKKSRNSTTATRDKSPVHKSPAITKTPTSVAGTSSSQEGNNTAEDVEMQDEEDDEEEEGGIRIGDIYLPPPPPPACTFDSTGPRLVITNIENYFFKSYAGKQVCENEQLFHDIFFNFVESINDLGELERQSVKCVSVWALTRVRSYR